MKWLLTPLDKHADDGLGATATAFRDAAEALLALPKDSRTDSVELPACFLLRHASELFLKSALVVLQRRFSNDQKRTGPLISVGAKRKPLHDVHSIQALYDGLIDLLNRNREQLELVTKTDWTSDLEELSDSIARIEKIDERSTFFRYPSGSRGVNDLKKSPYKSVQPEEMLERIANSGNDEEPVKAFLLVDPDYNVVEAYQYQPGDLEGTIADLQCACKWLDSFHVGLRVELADGW